MTCSCGRRVNYYQPVHYKISWILDDILQKYPSLDYTSQKVTDVSAKNFYFVNDGSSFHKNNHYTALLQSDLPQGAIDRVRTDGKIIQ